ncbi:MAG: hypothetical protein RMI91_03600 [Gemmatales bacterium]|nr:hypothetical protein [Gemmatales bacterium]MDW7993717.1 hypothetical protein [Gemmatales bacterium]
MRSTSKKAKPSAESPNQLSVLANFGEYRFREPAQVKESFRPLTVESLYQWFGDRTWPSYEVVAAEAVPPPYYQLLVHHDHMTVTLENYYGGPVRLRVLARRRENSWYGRKILLSRPSRVVQFGISRIDLDLCSPGVRDAILREAMPLGTVLIEHNVLRNIEPCAFLRLMPDEMMCVWFGLSEPRETFGRLALIHWDSRPAVELLEVLAPIC